MALVTFEPLGVSIECSDGETVFAAAQRSKVLIPTACVGRGNCGLCRVKVLAGEASLSPINGSELRHLGNTYYITKLRLSCQVKVCGPDDVKLLIPDAAKQLQKRSLLKPA